MIQIKEGGMTISKYADKLIERVNRVEEKLIKKFSKKLGAKSSTSQEDINKMTIEYVKSGKNIQKLHLSEAQTQDPQFMLELYRANPELTHIGYFDPTGELARNQDFVLEYIKIAYNYNKHGQTDLHVILRSFARLVRDVNFVESIIREFPNENIAEILNAVLSSPDKSKRDAEQEELNMRLSKIYENLSEEGLSNQAKRFGSAILKKLPRTLACYPALVNSGIEHDGFKSLRCLKVDQLLDNKDLIIKAYDKDGYDKLAEFFSVHLSPMRTKKIVQNGQVKEVKVLDERYAKVVASLSQDEDIQNIFTTHLQEQEDIQTSFNQ